MKTNKLLRESHEQTEMAKYIESYLDTAERIKGKRPTYSTIAKGCGTAKSVVHSWLKSGTMPRNLDAIAKYLASLSNEKEEEQIFEELSAIREGRESAFYENKLLSPAVQRGARKELNRSVETRNSIEEDWRISRLRQEKVARFGFVDYGAFSMYPRGGKSSFCFKLAEDFRAFAGLERFSKVSVGDSSLKTADVNLGDVQSHLCGSGSGKDAIYDVVFGFFATPKRMLDIRFSPLPITVPLNAVVFVPDLLRLSQETLSSLGVHETAEGQGFLKSLILSLQRAFFDVDMFRRVFHPVFMDWEVGGDYSQLTIGGLERGAFSTVEYEPDFYASELIKSPKDIPLDRIRIAVCDEHMCTDIIKDCGSTSQSSVEMKNLDLAGDFILLFNGPENKRYGSDGFENRRPRYRLCWGIDRDQVKYFDWFKESFDFFIDSNRQMVKLRLDELARELRLSLSDTFNLSMSGAKKGTVTSSRNWRNRYDLKVSPQNVSDATIDVLQGWFAWGEEADLPPSIGPVWTSIVRDWIPEFTIRTTDRVEPNERY